MWQVTQDIAAYAVRLAMDIVASASGGDDKKATMYCHVIIALGIAILAVLAIALLRDAVMLMDGGKSRDDDDDARANDADTDDRES